jgi:antirestriction protein ArdC
MLDIAQTITDRIISELEKGATPWVKPWKTLRSMPGAGMPFNPLSGTLFRGVNHFGFQCCKAPIARLTGSP